MFEGRHPITNRAPLTQSRHAGLYGLTAHVGGSVTQVRAAEKAKTASLPGRHTDDTIPLRSTVMPGLRKCSHTLVTGRP